MQDLSKGLQNLKVLFNLKKIVGLIHILQRNIGLFFQAASQKSFRQALFHPLCWNYISLQKEVSADLPITLPLQRNRVPKPGGPWWRESPFGTSASDSKSPGLFTSTPIQLKLTLWLQSWSHGHDSFLSSGKQKYNLAKDLEAFHSGGMTVCLFISSSISNITKSLNFQLDWV